MCSQYEAGKQTCPSVSIRDAGERERGAKKGSHVQGMGYTLQSTHCRDSPSPWDEPPPNEREKACLDETMYVRTHVCTCTVKANEGKRAVLVIAITHIHGKLLCSHDIGVSSSGNCSIAITAAAAARQRTYRALIGMHGHACL